MTTTNRNWHAYGKLLSYITVVTVTDSVGSNGWCIGISHHHHSQPESSGVVLVATVVATVSSGVVATVVALGVVAALQAWVMEVVGFELSQHHVAPRLGLAPALAPAPSACL